MVRPLIVAWLILVGVTPVFCEPVALTVTRLLTDGAVVQRDRVLPVWGSCAPGVGVTVSFGDLQGSAKSDAAGHWRVDLPPQPANAEGTDLVITTEDGQERVFADVLVGDLWLCAGQSNMELGMAAIANRAQEMKDLKVPLLRLYLISKSASGSPRNEVFGAWAPSDRVSVTTGGWNGFSAVAYTFGRKLQRELGVPVGVIQAAYGGSPIDAWIPPSDLAAEPSLSAYAAEAASADAAWTLARAADPSARHPYDYPSDTKDLGPSSIWHAMLEPLGSWPLRGVVWYQGETDVGDGPLYTIKLESLIAGWRRGFQTPGLPFYVVQIAPWAGYGGDSLPRLWAAQEAILSTPGTGLALTVDVGDPNDIHPSNKRPVGERLALQALSKTCGRADVVADGPVLRNVEASVVRWSFTGALATSDGLAPTGFEVLDDTGSWKSAKAELLPDAVRLLAGRGRGVRYAWSSTPQVNLTDATGLPARPFSVTW